MAPASGYARIDTLEERLLLTFDIQFDYTYDTSGFFSDQSRRDVLETAADLLESRITDDLNAITPGGVDTWTAVFNSPATGSSVSISNLTVPADTVIIYVGARNLGGALGIGGPAGFNSFASPDFNENLATRGEPGVDAGGTTDTDFAPWGGTLAIDSGVNWNFSLAPPSPGQNDFLSVAVHEIAHILGFGTSDSFSNNRNSSNQFIGSQTTSVFGGPIPLHTDQIHFASGTTGTLPGTVTTQEASLDPQITTGTRKLLTDLDWAALDDIGWDLTPPPAAADYGDAPDATNGTSFSDYQTRPSDNGPSHVLTDGLFIGDVAPDGDNPLLIGGLAVGSFNADDNNGTDDEGFPDSDFLAVVQGAVTPVNVTVTNTTGTQATLHGWIDYNTNGQFETSERASATVPAGTVNGTITLNFPAAGDADSPATFLSYARFRLSTDSAAASPVGPAADGEVEDHAVQVYSQTAAYDTLPSFTWTAVSSATRYELEVDNLTTGESQVILQSYIEPPGGPLSPIDIMKPCLPETTAGDTGLMTAPAFSRSAATHHCEFLRLTAHRGLQIPSRQQSTACQHSPGQPWPVQIGMNCGSTPPIMNE